MTYISPEDKLIKYIDSLVTPSSIVLDIGCGTKKIANSLHCAKVVTLDAWKPFEPDILCDLTAISKLPCEDDSFDLVLLIDVIEHLPKEHGIRILEEAKRVSKKGVVIFTPLWWDPNIKECNNPKSPYYQNEYDKHQSLWGADDLGEFEQIKPIEELSEYFLGVWRKGMKKIDLFLDISHQCNYNCLFCRSSLLPREILLLEQINHVNELLSLAKSVDITGYGEVTIHPQFGEFLKHFKKHKVSVRIVTNGSNLTEKIVDQIMDSTVTEVVISLNSLNPETYHKISGGKGDLGKTLKGVEHLIQRNDAVKKNIRIIFSFVMTQYTFPEIKDIIDFTTNHGKETSLLDLTPTINDYTPDLLVPDTQENRDYMESMIAYRDKIGSIKVSMFSFDSRKAVTVAAKDESALSEIVKRCDWVYTKTFIGFDGNVGVCCWSSAIMGNILEQPFSEIWNGNKYQELRDCIQRGDLKYCKNCRREC